MEDCLVVDAGLIGYAAGCELQQQLVAARKIDALPDVLFLCEHPHVVTLGRSGRRENLLASSRLLSQMNVEFHPTNRGGDITYHGPGQIVGYPILNLARIRRDVAWYVERLEETMILASADFRVLAKRLAGMRGVWVDTPAGPEKLGALGVHLSRWVTSHGFAYNVTTDLRYFDLIVPCGLAGCKAASLEKLLGCRVKVGAVKESIVVHFGEVFGRRMEPISPGTLQERLAVPVAAASAVP